MVGSNCSFSYNANIFITSNNIELNFFKITANRIAWMPPLSLGLFVKFSDMINFFLNKKCGI